ncbi:tetratricopeptide repeat protein [Noviherbaspirillum sp. ST9]|uniref:tetratricopeptide repeat protein n=1 Tax=Noviherbaspirillum sp. ST9 TaxID=3401606 RepID=UPI003B588C93
MSPAYADMAEDHEKAIQMWQMGNVVDAMGTFTVNAEKGYAPSQVWLANLMDQAQQDEGAVKWFTKAAEQGFAAGEYGLGVMYGKGEGVKQDSAKAIEYVTRAAEKDYIDAVVALAGIYSKGGFGVEPNAEKGEYWTARAAALAPKEEQKQETGKKKRRK